jgi:hypothetical protein
MGVVVLDGIDMAAVADMAMELAVEAMDMWAE